MATLKKYYYIVHEDAEVEGDEERYTIYTSDSKEKLLTALREAETGRSPYWGPKSDAWYSVYIDNPAKIKEV
jgi:hypothetical protein